MGRKRYKTRQVYEYKQTHNGVDYGCFNSDINALEAAVKERLFYVKDEDGVFVRPPSPVPEVFSQRLGYVSKFFTDNLTIVSPLTKEQFLGAYDGRKRTIYEKAYDSLLVRPLDQEDSVISYFMKVEKVNFTAKPNAVPRGISPRNPRYHVSLGPYIKRIEKTIFNMINKLWKSCTIFKGLNADQRGRQAYKKWKRFKNPVAVGIDAKRFDQHVSVDALKWEHSVYLSFFQGRDRKRLAKLLRKQLKNIGKGRTQDGGLRFTLDGGRMSGDMNTALGNCLLMSAMVHSFCKRKGLDCELMNDGDDCVLILERRDLRKLDDLYDFMLDYGFNLEIEKPVYELEHIEFCQSRPLMVDENKCRMVRNVRTSLAKDSVSILPLRTEKEARSWSRAVGECGLSLTSGIPVVSSFYNLFMKASDKAMKLSDTQLTGMNMLAKGMGKACFKAPSALARLSYYKAFGVPPEVQIQQERHFDNLEINYKPRFDKAPTCQPHAILRL